MGLARATLLPARALGSPVVVGAAAPLVTPLTVLFEMYCLAMSANNYVHV